MRIKSATIILCMLLFRILASGQSQEDRFARIYPVFNQHKNWSARWFGTIDGRMHVSMYLARNKDNEYRGLYTYESSGLSFQLEGEMNDEGLINLKEIDSLQRVTGSFVGDIHQDVFSGEWQDYKQYQSMPFELLSGKFPDDAGSYQVFRAPRFPDITLLIEKKSGLVYLTILRNGEFIKTILEQKPDKVYLYKGTLENSEGSLSEVLFSLNPNLYYIEILDEDTRRLSIRLEEQVRIPNIARDHTTFGSTVALLYPHTQNQKFNSWIFEKLKSWYSEQITKMADLDQNISDFMHEERFSKNAIAEVTLDLTSNDLISGLIRYSSSLSDSVIEETFIYSLAKNRELSLAEFFPKGSNMATIIQELGQGEKIYETIAVSEDEGMPSWDLVSLSNFGLMLRSRFSTLIGQSEALIHPDLVRPFLSKNELSKKPGIWQ